MPCIASRIRLLAAFLVLIAVIDVGHVLEPAQGPLGFGRIARDLGRKFCSSEGTPVPREDAKDAGN